MSIVNADLHGRYERATGQQRPVEFAERPRHVMQKAVEAVERGDTPFVPKPMPREEEQQSSLMDWDRHDDRYPNSY